MHNKRNKADIQEKENRKLEQKRSLWKPCRNFYNKTLLRITVQIPV